MRHIAIVASGRAFRRLMTKKSVIAAISHNTFLLYRVEKSGRQFSIDIHERNRKSNHVNEFKICPPRFVFELDRSRNMCGKMQFSAELTNKIAENHRREFRMCALCENNPRGWVGDDQPLADALTPHFHNFTITHQRPINNRAIISHTTAHNSHQFGNIKKQPPHERATDFYSVCAGIILFIRAARQGVEKIIHIT